MPPAIWLLCAGTFVNRFGSFVHVFILLFLTRQGYSASAAGLAASAYGVGSVGAALLGGVAADRWGRRQTILVSMLGSASVLLALSAADDIRLVAALTLHFGALAELYRPASAAVLADLTEAGNRVPAFALYRLAINAGVALGPATAGVLAGYSFRWLFYIDALSSVVFGAVALVRVAGGGARTRPPRA